MYSPIKRFQDGAEFQPARLFLIDVGDMRLRIGNRRVYRRRPIAYDRRLVDGVALVFIRAARPAPAAPAIAGGPAAALQRACSC